MIRQAIANKKQEKEEIQKLFVNTIAETDKKFRMREKLISGAIEIFNEAGDVQYSVSGAWLTDAQTLVDHKTGKELLVVKKKMVSLVPRYRVKRDGQTLLEVFVKPSLVKDRLTVKVSNQTDNTDLLVIGNIVGKEYSVTRGEKEIVHISRKILSLAESYGIEVKKGEDEAVMLALVLIIDRLE